MTDRKCHLCDRPITACFGFVLARDIVSGRVPIREQCSVCIETGRAKQWNESHDPPD